MHRCLMGVVSAKNLTAPGSRQTARHDCSDRAAATAALTQLCKEPGHLQQLQ